jgi:hypothetical protein
MAIIEIQLSILVFWFTDLSTVILSDEAHEFWCLQRKFVESVLSLIDSLLAIFDCVRRCLFVGISKGRKFGSLDDPRQ